MLLDAARAVLFDSGVVNAPSGPLGADNRFTLAVPTVAGVRHVRYTMASCAESAWPVGFAEIRVHGTADITTPAFQLGKKFQALEGREAHSTPIVVNLTDDNGDGLINADDIPDIVVPVEALTNQLRGEVKAISGADGTELFTAGAPDLVSPWSELAAGDIDGDGRPEIVAVHSDGNHLIAFEHTGAQKWISDANAMPRFGAQFVGGAVSIANLDGAGAPEIIVGASVFDANGRLLADGRTLGGTTGGDQPALRDLRGGGHRSGRRPGDRRRPDRLPAVGRCAVNRLAENRPTGRLRGDCQPGRRPRGRGRQRRQRRGLRAQSRWQRLPRGGTR